MVQFPYQYQTTSAPLLIIQTGDDEGALQYVASQDISFIGSSLGYRSTVGDFNGDGYDDLLLEYSRFDLQSQGIIRIATAVDVNDPSKGFKFGPELPATPESIWRMRKAASCQGISMETGSRKLPCSIQYLTATT